MLLKTHSTYFPLLYKVNNLKIYKILTNFNYI